MIGSVFDGIRLLLDQMEPRQRQSLRAVAPALASVPFALSISMVYEITHWQPWTAIAGTIIVILDTWAWIRFRPLWKDFWGRMEAIRDESSTTESNRAGPAPKAGA